MRQRGRIQSLAAHQGADLAGCVACVEFLQNPALVLGRELAAFGALDHLGVRALVRRAGLARRWARDHLRRETILGRLVLLGDWAWADGWRHGGGVLSIGVCWGPGGRAGGDPVCWRSGCPWCSHLRIECKPVSERYLMSIDTEGTRRASPWSI